MLKIYLIYVLIPSQYVYCDLQEVVVKRIEQFRNKSERLYGSDNNLLPLQSLGIETDEVSYPRGNKQKLFYISQQWLRYYECSSQLLGSLTKHRTLPSKIVVAYEEAVARITCGLCVAPDERNKLMWMYAKSANQIFAPLKPRSTIVGDGDGNLTIYLVKTQDSGVYRCNIGQIVGGLVVLEVLDEGFRLVKPKASQGPYSEPVMHITKNMMLYSVWSPWSECNRCDVVGRRRRFGMCYVRIRAKGNQVNKDKSVISNDTVSNENLDAFINFPMGIPCRSQYLPVPIREVSAVKTRLNEIMLGLCRIPCKELVPNVNLLYFRGLHSDNKSNGELSPIHPLPPQPPCPTATFVFVDRGKPLTLTCTGTTLRDVPYTWRIGNKKFIPRATDEESSGRVYLNARDQLVFTRVEYSDTNLYSCWQNDALCSSIKLNVECGVEQDWRRYAVALTAIAIAAILLRILILLED